MEVVSLATGQEDLHILKLAHREMLSDVLYPDEAGSTCLCQLGLCQLPAAE